MAPVAGNILPQRGDFEWAPAHHDRDRTMLDSGRHRLESGGLRARDHDVRMCGGSKVDIACRQAEQTIAHRSADDACFFAIAVQELEKIDKPAALQQRSGRVLRIDLHSKWPGTSRP